MGRLSTFFDILFCCMLALPATISLWNMAGFPASWDFAAHIVSATKVTYWLQRGVYPLRFPEFLPGGSSPNFYSPLLLLLSAFFSLLTGVDPPTGMKISLILSFELTAITMYDLSRRILNSRQGAIVSSVGFTYAGFHITNVLTQGMYPAALAFVFLPAVFGYLYLSVRDNRPSFALYSGIALGLMILSHMLTAYATVLFFFLFGALQALLNLRFPRIALRAIIFLTVAVVCSLGVSGWFLIPFIQSSGNAFLSHGMAVGFTNDPYMYARRATPIDRFFIRYPPELAATHTAIPLYIGTVLTCLALISVALLIRHPKSTRITDSKSSNQYVFLMLLLFVFSILFCSYTQWIPLLPLSLSRYIFLTQFPSRAAFLPSFAAAVLAGYSVARISSSHFFTNLGERLNLDFNPSKVLALALCLLLMVDSSIYFMDPSPYQYQADYPPYGSMGLDLSYKWISQQKGYFRVIDPLGGVYARWMTWDKLMLLGTVGDASFAPYSENTARTWKWIQATDDSVNETRLKGYFGVKYGIGHLHDPRKAFEFAGTEWVPVATFYEITIFENPYFRPLVEIVDDFDSPPSVAVGQAEITGFDANRIEVTTSSDRNGFLVVKWWNSPDWNCLLDGRPIRILENQYGFMYIALSPGEHHVRFTYWEQQANFIRTYLIVLTAVTVLGLAYGYRRSHRRNASSVDENDPPPST